MDATLFLNRFLQNVRANPNVTSFKLHENIVTNARFVQYIAPIMNELDTVSTDKIALLMEPSVHTYAAIFAAVFNGKVIVPILESWTEQQREAVCKAAGITEILTSRRMEYYYWMTVEDALDRIDNGLISLQNNQIIAQLYDFKEDGIAEPQTITLDDFSVLQSLAVKCLDLKMLNPNLMAL